MIQWQRPASPAGRVLCLHPAKGPRLKFTGPLFAAKFASSREPRYIEHMHLAPRVCYSGIITRLAGGFGGVVQTLRVMRQMVRAYSTDPRMRNVARSIIFLTPEKDEVAEVAALFNFVRDSIRYMRDVHEVETISTPDKTLASRVGDCDDQTTLLATLLQSVGYPTRFIVTGYETPGQYEHVYMQVFVNGEWVDCDPTEQGAPLGWSAPMPVSVYVEQV